MHKYVLWFGLSCCLVVWLFVEFAYTPTINTTTKLIFMY